MNFIKLFDTQRILDQRIELEHPRENGEDRLSKKILALLVELGELANEQRTWKFWSSDKEPRVSVRNICDSCDGSGDINWPSSVEMIMEGKSGHPYEKCEYCNGTGERERRNLVLEEYVDCLHFILSIGNELGYKYEITGPMYIGTSNNPLMQFRGIFRKVSDLEWSIICGKYTANGYKKIVYDYQDVFKMFIGLGDNLGFTWEQIEAAYYEKNEVNHKRQDNNY